MLKARLIAVDSNIRKSELFPRIRDAEIEMKRYEKDLLSRLKQKKIRAKKKFREPTKSVFDGTNEDLIFTSFELDKDPKSAQYMPYNKVYFPKIPDMNKPESSRHFKPETIDNFWVIGFQDSEAAVALKNGVRSKRKKSIS